MTEKCIPHIPWIGKYEREESNPVAEERAEQRKWEMMRRETYEPPVDQMNDCLYLLYRIGQEANNEEELTDEERDYFEMFSQFVHHIDRKFLYNEIGNLFNLPNIEAVVEKYRIVFESMFLEILDMQSKDAIEFMKREVEKSLRY